MKKNNKETTNLKISEVNSNSSSVKDPKETISQDLDKQAESNKVIKEEDIDDKTKIDEVNFTSDSYAPDEINSYDNASMVINNLISCEHYPKTPEDKENLIPFLNKISFAIKRNEIYGISADNKFALNILIEILGNMRSYYKGFVKLTNLGTSTIKRAINEKIFYVDSHKMVYEDMTLIEQLMLIAVMQNKDKNVNYADLERSILDMIMKCSMEDLVAIKIKHLSNSTKMVIAILVACMSYSEKIIINAIDYEFAQADCERLSHIFDYFHIKKTIVFASMQSKLIGMCANHVIFINHGVIKADCSINELYLKWDHISCSIKCDDNEKFSKILVSNYKGVTTSIIDNVIYVKNYGDQTVAYKDIYDLGLRNKIRINFIRFNGGRVENAFNEIKETFNDIY
jgi:ABC-type multidrug transport system, ATPase component